MAFVLLFPSVAGFHEAFFHRLEAVILFFALSYLGSAHLDDDNQLRRNS